MTTRPDPDAFSRPSRLVVLLDTSGVHVDGAPICFGALQIDLPILLKLRDEILDRRKGATAFSGPARRTVDDDSPFALTYYPARSLQRRPFAKEWRQMSRENYHIRIVVPEMVMHLSPVPATKHEVILTGRSISFHAVQWMPERPMTSWSLDLNCIYCFLTLLTPREALPDLLREMTVEAPQVVMDWYHGEIGHYAPGGKVICTPPELNTSTIKTLVMSPHRVLREFALVKLAEAERGETHTARSLRR